MKRLKTLYRLQLKSRVTLLSDEGLALLKKGSKPGDFKETCALADKLHNILPGCIDVVATDKYEIEEVEDEQSNALSS
jgi:hypothetical protein